ncbi:MAG: helix-turn-helix domain-containing protein [Heliobacteriaceae bacterium]|jgi:transcriptional regulator with XRE-family HTH domain|nr:helix-turn-helix domain-containing protein [Heliobacteriaceae bacterium]
MQHVGEYIRKKRLETGKSLNKFAFEAGIEPAILSRVENSKQDIKLGVLNKIANNFGVSAGAFLMLYERQTGC